jgi:hypothetical protein
MVTMNGWVKARYRSQPTHSAIVKREVCNEEFGRSTNENMEAGGVECAVQQELEVKGFNSPYVLKY